MEKVKVYQLNEYDGVAAEFLEQAREFYLKVTGLSDDDAFYDYEANEVNLEQEVWEDKSRTKKQTLRSVIAEYWSGEPFIAFSSER
ncbi:hypothetical protein [Siminovitchia fordii]|uniref:Phage protein n=1 Tax=Siminovitchia fordii TaxID=254759 RepID=A0ABQ4KCC7_9BACI|nr:hypothetical protein [Siminovitchia fordii]GIN22528.1 hypothetical protein J1TS3_36620 [Siminovitchia fordii]